ncbi:MAG: hypothetical protein CMM48_00795 [Rhodospirillaceae bacterium]|nr:hypothetical protein [Rhodospirillaceae bacterium]
MISNPENSMHEPTAHQNHVVPDQSPYWNNGVVSCDTREGLAAINGPDAELVIWQRTLPAGLRDWISQTDVDHLPYLRILVEPDGLPPALEPLLDEFGLPADDKRDLLIEDIDKLVRMFADITRGEFVDVRLERIEHDACKKFHRDNVEARLVTTYRGPTTEWVRMDHAEHALRQQKQYDGPIEHLGEHDVAFFKGSRAGTNNGVVHRSPPIAGTGATRLFLCLNKRTSVSPDPEDIL